MRNIREILSLRLGAGLSIRQIRASTKVSVGAIQKLLVKADEEGVTWPLLPELDDTQLARLFYPGADTRVSARYQRPDWPTIHQELKCKGVTKLLLWEEYTQQYPNRCYSYSQFCDRYGHWRGLQKRSMRQIHKAGEKCFVDYGVAEPKLSPSLRPCERVLHTIAARQMQQGSSWPGAVCCIAAIHTKFLALFNDGLSIFRT